LRAIGRLACSLRDFQNVTPLEKKKRSILLVDDHPIFRRGLADLLNQEGDFEVNGEAASYAEALDAVRRERFDLVIVDLGLGDTADGLELIKSIKAEQPKTAILVMSVRDEAIYAGRALRAGALGYIMKRESVECVLSASRCVFGGEVYLSPVMTKRFIHNQVHGSSESGEGVDLLTDRELEVFHLIGHGGEVREIARNLNLSGKTVEAHRERIKQKMDFASSRELARFASNWMVEKR
jgi:DNA-binding NarL/FixJ family response regulator